MTGTPDSFDEAPLSSNGQGPGRLVRQARETRGLSIEDLAAQIKLARNTLDAIERDDFAQLNEPVRIPQEHRCQTNHDGGDIPPLLLSLFVSRVLC